MRLFVLLIFCFLITCQGDESNIDEETLKLLSWTEGIGETDGTTRDYINRAVLLPWRNYMGDFVDSNNELMGTSAYSTSTLVDDNVQEFVSWDVTTLVNEWIDGGTYNNGFFLKMTSGSGSYNFRSREYSDASQRPQLVLVDDVAGEVVLSPEKDCFLETSTYRGQGNSDNLKISDTAPILIKFDLSEQAAVSSATLKLYAHSEYASADPGNDVGVFRVALSPYTIEPVRYGISRNFINDTGIDTHANVVFYTTFNETDWGSEWTHGGDADNLDLVESDPGNKFTNLFGKALRVKLAANTNTGLSLGYGFADKNSFGGDEPEEIYFRYYLRLTDSWMTGPVDGGKMPGISGTYGVAGWGGRKVDGTNGWSSRGSFKGPPIPQGNPMENRVALGNYVYHTDMAGTYGDIFMWDRNVLGFVKINQWHCVEQYVKMNTPTQNNGILRTWINGRLAHEKSDLNFRNVDTLRIEKIWMNIYHGGTDVAVGDFYTFIDNVVIATDYIGPVWPPLNAEEEIPGSTRNPVGIILGLVFGFGTLFLIVFAVVIFIIVVISVVKLRSKS